MLKNIRNDFCIFILTHDNVNNRTLKFLRDEYGTSYPTYLVVDDKDPKLEEYKRVHGDRLCVFSKDEYRDKFDIMDNFDFDKVVVFARNACFDIAERLGYKYFITFDDDYRQIALRFPNEKWLNLRDSDLDSLLTAYVDFYSKFDKLKILAFMQGGDFDAMSRGVVKRKVMNSMFFSTDRRVEFKGRLNEDVNVYSKLNSIGDVCLSFPMVSVVVKDMTQHGGGLTDAYLNFGTYVKSFYSVMQCPSFIKISVLNGIRHKRIHHNIDSDLGVVKIISSRYKK